MGKIMDVKLKKYLLKMFQLASPPGHANDCNSFAGLGYDRLRVLALALAGCMDFELLRR